MISVNEIVFDVLKTDSNIIDDGHAMPVFQLRKSYLTSFKSFEYCILILFSTVQCTTNSIFKFFILPTFNLETLYDATDRRNLEGIINPLSGRPETGDI